MHLIFESYINPLYYPRNFSQLLHALVNFWLKINGFIFIPQKYILLDPWWKVICFNIHDSAEYFMTSKSCSLSAYLLYI